MAERPAAALPVADDEELEVDDDLLDDPGLAPEPPLPSIPPGPRRLVVPDGEVIRRVDRFVADRTGLSRSYVQRLISDGRLVDDDGRRLRANSEVRGGGVTLEVPPPEVPYHLEPDPTITVSVVYQDDDLLIVDKPSGLVVHPAPGHWQGTLVNALLARGDHYGGIAGVARPGIVHRLDRDTSGLLIVARNDAAQASVMAQLKARRVRKTYLALVQGSVAASVGRIEAPIGRDPKDRKRMAVVPDGRPALTGYRVRERFPAWTLLELDLVHSGRTRSVSLALGPRWRRQVTGREPPAGPGRPGAPVPARLAPRARVAVLGEAGARGGAAARGARGGARGLPRARPRRGVDRREAWLTEPDILLGAPGRSW
jgi:23S rRNA pseudouridine1911/1915/1917 synthase